MPKRCHRRSCPPKQGNEGGPSNQQSNSLEVACLCNLALACIKLGHFDDVEEACNRALLWSPSCSKALFRRGQARLAVGKPTDAASDFLAAARLEPANPEIRRMLDCCKERGGLHSDKCDGNNAPQCDSEGIPVGGNVVREQRNDDDDGYVATDYHDDAVNNIETANRGIGSSDRSRLVDSKTPPPSSSASLCSGGDSTSSAKNIESEEKVSADLSLTNKSDVDAYDSDFKHFLANPFAQEEHSSGFLVPGWLSSAERALVEKSRNEDKITLGLSNTEMPMVCLKAGNKVAPSSDSIAIDGINTRKGAQYKTSVSVVVSDLKKRQDINKRGSRAKPIVECEWLSLNDDETKKLKEVRQRLGSTTVADVEPAPPTRAQRRKSGSERPVKGKDELMSGGGKIPLQASEWASLVEEEKQVRDTFRSKSVVGHKGKNKKNKKEPYLRLSRSDCGGGTLDSKNGNV